ncbi:MAG: MSMEG_0570 family nitrogen starvation response protein [Pseudomonadota bacterium]
MPEVRFHIRWPDGSEEACYSPSTVIRDHLSPGQAYALSDFLARSETALDQAALRVQAKLGFRCSNADAQAARIKLRAATFGPEETVTCLSMT